MKVYTSPLKWISLLALWAIVALPVLPAQICQPDPAYTASGTYPATIPPACAGNYYETVITVVVPPDTVFAGFLATVDSVVLRNVIGTPPGITYACAPSGCRFPGGSAGCVLVSGTPTAAGSYPVDLVTEYYVSTFLGALSFVDTAFAFYTLDVLPGVDVAVSASPAACGVADGSVALTPLSGTAPFSYAWSTGDSTASLSDLAAGLYTVTVSDSNGCSADFSVDVPNAGAPPVVDVTGAVSWSGCAEDSSGQIAPLVSGGAGPYAYAWSNGETTLAIGNVPAGSYSLTVTDSLGCTATAAFQVVAPDVLTVAATPTAAACFGEASGSALATVSGGLAPYAYTWSGLPAQTGPLADLLPAGTYTVTVSDSLGCTKTAEVSVSEPDALTLVFDVTDASGPANADGEIIASASGGSGAYTFAWASGASGDTLRDLTAGSYVLTLTDANGCTLTDTVLVGSLSSLPPLAGLHTAQVYPNPARETLWVEMELAQPRPLTLRLINLHGQTVHVQAVAPATQPRVRLALHDLPAGLYLLSVADGQGVWTTRVQVAQP